MFYSQVILAKKGPLAKVWLAAHWGDKKLARPQIFATDISQSCTDIMNPSVPLALRLSGHLLLGVVRIYSRKVKYVLNDCTEAMLKLQMAFTKQVGNGGIGGIGNNQLLDGSDGKGGGRELLSDKDAPIHQLVSNFGEYDQVHIVEGFCLPLPEDNEWILAEDDDEDEIPQEQHLLVAARFPQAQQGRSPDHVMASPEEETWAPFDPDNDDDDDEDDNNNNDINNDINNDHDNNKYNEERSQVSDIEIVRAANESILSEDQTRRSISMIGDKSTLTEDGGVARTDGNAAAAGAGENPDDYDFNVPFADDESEDEQGVGDFTAGDGSGDGPPNLDLSRDGTTEADGTPGGGGNNSVANMSGLAMDDDSATQASNKRPHEEEKKPRKRRRKRRKVVIDNNATELLTEHIRDMISNTDGIVRTMIHPASIWDEEGLGRDYKTLVKERLARDGITIINFTTTASTTTGGNNKKKSSTNKKNGENVVPSLTRPFLVDESEMNGGESRLHPDLQKLWQDNYWKALDQPCPFKRLDVAAAEDGDDAMEDEPVDDVERVRRDDGKADDDSDLGSQQSDLNVEKEDQEPQEGGPPLDEDDFNFPTGDDDDEEEEEQEEDAPVPDFGDDEEEQDLGVVNRSRDENDMLELGMANDMILDSDEDDDDDDDDLANRQALGDVASSTTKWHKHTVRVFQHLKKCMKDPNQEYDGGGAASAEDADDEPKKDLPEQISFKDLTKNVVSRRNAASVFFEMLQLKTWDFIDLDQEDSYGDITISPGIRFGESGGGLPN